MQIMQRTGAVAGCQMFILLDIIVIIINNNNIIIIILIENVAQSWLPRFDNMREDQVQE